MKNQRAFTLIELLVVIAIIGILAGLVILGFNASRNKARVARVNSDLKQFINTAMIAREEQNQTLIQVTGSGCSRCYGCSGIDLRGSTGQCYTTWMTSLSNVQLKSGITTNLTQIARDPWGSPYLMDENELEFNGSDCRFDAIRSAGPDGYFGSGDDTTETNIPHYVCNP